MASLKNDIRKYIFITEPFRASTRAHGNVLLLHLCYYRICITTSPASVQLLQQKIEK